MLVIFERMLLVKFHQKDPINNVTITSIYKQIAEVIDDEKENFDEKNKRNFEISI